MEWESRCEIVSEYEDWQTTLAEKYPEGLPSDNWTKEDDNFCSEQFVSEKSLQKYWEEKSRLLCTLSRDVNGPESFIKAMDQIGEDLGL